MKTKTKIIIIIQTTTVNTINNKATKCGNVYKKTKNNTRQVKPKQQKQQ